MNEKRTIRQVTIDEAKRLPNMLGVLSAIELRAHGTYCYENVSTGEKITLVLKAGSDEER